ncbi:YfaZ family outer membrane protein [Inmirania thermothiophila]|uniref:YfaZ n=1 Tax=Inmirania thermothiophila TaxID=1750597 RepID=A0A3N1Y631_9GAMM|nr:YfaZ family outer membrane protein [Inmirania thermothiophila]ROR34263.1 YfaZ precursor [Inmirania thermothiophila]
MKARHLAALLLGAAALGVRAQGLDISLSDDAVRAAYTSAVAASRLGNAQWNIGLIANDGDDALAHGGLEVVGDPAPGSGFTAAAGLRAYLGTAGDQDVLALGLGGRLRYVFPAANRFAIQAEAFYAPGIVSFLDSDGQSDFSIQGEYEILRTAIVYLGYRRVRSELEAHRDVDVDKGGYFGLRLIF